MSESQPLEPSEAECSARTARGPTIGEADGELPRGAASVLSRWCVRTDSGEGVPEREARLVVRAVLDSARGVGPEEGAEAAGRAWGAAHRSVVETVDRLSHLREVLVALEPPDARAVHRALDRVTSAAVAETMARLERASRTDVLTGVGNRRAFDETVQRAVAAAARQGHDVTVVVVDLDGLKRVNDTAGHRAGDAALVSLVRVLTGTLRDEDTVFRLGGDEFVVVLPFTAVDVAEALMRRIQAVGAPAFTWGAAGFPQDGADAWSLVDAADRDMYRHRESRGRSHPRRRRTGAPRPVEASKGPWRWASVSAAATVTALLAATVVPAAYGGHAAGRSPRAGASATFPSRSGDRSHRPVVVTPSSPSPGAPAVPVGAPAPSVATSAAIVGFPADDAGPLVPPAGGAAGGQGAQNGVPGAGGAPAPPSGNPVGGLLSTVGQLLGRVPGVHVTTSPVPMSAVPALPATVSGA